MKIAELTLLWVWTLLAICKSASVKPESKESFKHKVGLVELLDGNGMNHIDRLSQNLHGRRILSDDEQIFSFSVSFNRRLESRMVDEKIQCNDLKPIGNLRSIAEDLKITVHDIDSSRDTNETITDSSRVAYKSTTIMSSDFACVVTFIYADDKNSGVMKIHGVRRGAEDNAYEDFHVTNCGAPEAKNDSCVVLQSRNSDETRYCEVFDSASSLRNRKLTSQTSTNSRGESFKRHLEAVEALPFKLDRWADCYDGDENTHQMSIGISVGSHLVSTLGGTAYVVPYIEAMVSEVNVIFIQQMNVKFIVSAVEIVTPNAAGSVVWDNKGCRDSIDDQLENYMSFDKDTDDVEVGVWHLLDDCWESGTIGATVMDALCTDHNSAITWFEEKGGTWLTFAHEMGHTLGAEHSFEEGQGLTGGIMDYGDRLYTRAGSLNEYQFNTKYRKEQVCDLIKDRLDCPAWTILTSKYVSDLSTCGNGKLDDGEECECPDRKLKCDCCSNCQLRAAAKCSPFSNECCTDQCMYQPTTTMCTHSSGPGYCRNGNCAASMCAIAGGGDFCGVYSKEFPCWKTCEYSGICQMIPSNYYYNDRKLRYIRNGAFCQTSAIDFGQCMNGYCVEVYEREEETTNSPTSFPTMTPAPTLFPTEFPTTFPTIGETESPTPFPVTENPTPFPTSQNPTKFPTKNPTKNPIQNPTKFPTLSPTKFPTISPTLFPTAFPITGNPTKFPTKSPTQFPTEFPTKFPTQSPTKPPVQGSSPTKKPTAFPTEFLTKFPSPFPTTKFPTTFPTKSPTMSPTSFPTKSPTPFPTTRFPTSFPTKKPTLFPTEFPTRFPTVFPTTKSPTPFPTTLNPTKYPSEGSVDSTAPTPYPTFFPTMYPDSVDDDPKEQAKYCCDTLQTLYGPSSFRYSSIPTFEVCAGNLWAGKACKPTSFSEAQSICSKNGARLCSSEELKILSPDVSTCSAYSDFVWSYDTCASETGDSGILTVSVDGSKTTCTSPSEVLTVTCCSDTC